MILLLRHVFSLFAKKTKKFGFGGSQSVWNAPGGSEKYGKQHTKVLGRSPNNCFFWKCCSFFGVDIDFVSKYLRNIFQRIGPAGGWGRSRPFFGVNIDYFAKYLRKIFQKIRPAGGWGRGRPVHPRPTQAGPAPTPRALFFEKFCVNILKNNQY